MSDRCALAVDVGGSAVKLAYATPDRRLHDVRSVPVEQLRSGGDVLPALAELVEAAVKDAPAPLRPGSVGIVVPGIVDEQAGVGRLSYMLGWRDAPLRALIETASGLPTRLGHDVGEAAVAEGALGAARGHREWIFLALGTGLGSALMLDGRPYRGSNGWGGELSHVVVDRAGARCPCGKRGCLELLASASALSQNYAVRTGRRLTAVEIATLARAGDPAAAQVWAGAVDALAIVLAGVVETLNPSLVVVGGGMSASGDQLLRPLRASLRQQVAFVQPVPDVVGAQLGVHAGTYGAALLGLDLLTKADAR